MLANATEYSPVVKDCTLVGDVIDQPVYNDIGLKTIGFGLTSKLTEFFTGNSTFKELVYGVTAGALDAAPTMRSADMDKVTNAQFKAHISNRWANVVFRNNDLVPVDITLTLWRAHKSTSNAPMAIWDDQQDEAYHAEVDRDHMHFDSLTNYKGVIFQGGWKMIGKTIKFRLNPGDEYSWSKKLGSCTVDYDQYLSSFTYQAGYSYALILRTVGCICHDTTDTTLVGYSKHQIDYVIKSKDSVRISHRQGLLKGKVETNSLDTITTGAITMADVATENPI